MTTNNVFNFQDYYTSKLTQALFFKIKVNKKWP